MPEYTNAYCDSHYLVKCEHLAGHLSPVVQGDPHPIVDLLTLDFHRYDNALQSITYEVLLEKIES
jgi:hypothetical protein